MRLWVLKKYFCLMAVMFFVLPSVAGLEIDINRRQDRYSGFNTLIEPKTNQDFVSEPLVLERISQGELSQELAMVWERYPKDTLDPELNDYLVRFNEKMLARRARFVRENPGLPYIPLDITKQLAKVDPITGLIVPAFSGAILGAGPEMIRFDFSPTNIYSPLKATTSDNNDAGSRQEQDLDADLELASFEWLPVNAGWGNYFDDDPPGSRPSYGGFQVGRTTTFEATIVNHNPGISVKNVKVNFTVVDFNSNIPMQRNPVTKIVNITGATTKITHEFTPPFAGNIYAICTVDYLYDPDTSNNGQGWYNMHVFIWSADFEGISSDTAWGWQKLVKGNTIINTESQWTGDIDNSANAKDIWHITDTPTNGELNDHTKTDAWFHGEDSLVRDTYSDQINRNINATGKNHTYLETPVINLGTLSDGQDVMGELEEDYFYPAYTPWYSPMITGELEDNINSDSDKLWVNEIADDSTGENWKKNPFTWGYIIGDWSQLGGQTTQHWNPLFSVFGNTMYVGFPFTLLAGDGSGGRKYLGGAKNLTMVRYRVDFCGDGEDDQTTETGMCTDDYAAWGMHEYVVDDRVGITKLTYPKTDDISILYSKSEMKFSTAVKNYGTAKNVFVKIEIYDFTDGELGGLVYQPAAENMGWLENDQESDEKTFRWTPETPGDFKLIVTAGDYSKDWTPADNRRELVLHVGPAQEQEVEFLIVDDDDSAGQGGIFTINTEFRMLRAFKDNGLNYRVYTVEYNETGPEQDIMADYGFVTWLTGLDNEFTAHAWRNGYLPNNKAWDVTLKEADEQQMANYLNNKGKLWLVSPGYLYDIYGGSASITGSGSFAYQYLKIDRCKANESTPSTPNPLDGVTGSCMDGAEYLTYDDPPIGFIDIGGWIEMASTDKVTHYLFWQDEAHYYYNSLHYRSQEFVSAFFAFNFYMISERTDRADCVHRLLTCSGMLGGVKIEPYDNNELTKQVVPGQSGQFRLKVTNTGKSTDTMTLSVTRSSQYLDWEAWFEVGGIKKTSVDVAGLASVSNVYLFVQSPAPIDLQEYPKAGTYIGFDVKAVSKNTHLENSTRVYAKVGGMGNITISAYDTKKELNIDETTEFQLRLLNETNSDNEVTVSLTTAGDGSKLAKFTIKSTPNDLPKIETTLKPNQENSDIGLQVTTDDHTPAGFHNLTVGVKDDSNMLRDELELTVRVNQFYQVKCETDGDMEDGKSNLTIDPNNYNNVQGEYIKKSFIIRIQNYGNGFDNIALAHEENAKSETISGWEFGIISPDTFGNLSTVNVRYYSEDSNPMYGEEEVWFDVYIPKSVKVGTYIVDFVVQSSQPEIYNPLEDEQQNNRVSFSFKIIKPNLRFTPLQPGTNIDNVYFLDQIEFAPITRDYSHNNEFYVAKPHDKFAELVIEVKVTVDNIGTSEVALGRENIMIQLSRRLQDSGEIVIDRNLTPEQPRDSKLIVPGENVTFTFIWDNIEQDVGTEVEYLLKIIVDPSNEIRESNEDDNSGTVVLSINHLKPPEKPDGGDNVLTVFSLIIIIAIIAVVIYLMIIRKRRRNGEGV